MTEQHQIQQLSDQMRDTKICDSCETYRKQIHGNMSDLHTDEYYDEYMMKQQYSWNSSKGHKGHVARMNRLKLRKKQIEELEMKREINLNTINNEIRRLKIERLVIKHIIKNNDEEYMNAKLDALDQRQR